MWLLLESNLICVKQLLIYIFERGHNFIVCILSALKYFFLKVVSN